MAVRACLRTRHPYRRGSGACRDAPVSPQRHLEESERPPLGDTLDVPARHLVRLLGQHAARHLDPGLAQHADPAPRHARVGIEHTYDGALQAGGDDRLGTRRRLAVVRAGLERHIDRGAAGAGTGAPDRLGLGVRTAAGLGPAARDDLARRLVGDRGPDRRIGRGGSEPALGHAQRDPHHVGVEVCGLAHGFCSDSVSSGDGGLTARA